MSPGGAAVLTAALVFAFAAATGARIATYADGAPPGFSGGFKEDSCHACHFHNDLNLAPGRVEITVPQRFTPGTPYRIVIALTRPGMKLAGFQLTARFADNGQQAGVLTPVTTQIDRVGVETYSDILYATQRRAGALPATTGTARWELDWTAPKHDGPVVFHVAANAADGDETAEGDYIYTASATSAPPHAVRR